MCNSCFQKVVFEKIFLGYLFVFFTSKQQSSEFFHSWEGFRELDKITDWAEKCLDQRPCEFEFLGLIMFLLLFLGGFDLVPYVCFRRRVVVMGREN